MNHQLRLLLCFRRNESQLLHVLRTWLQYLLRVPFYSTMLKQNNGSVHKCKCIFGCMLSSSLCFCRREELTNSVSAYKEDPAIRRKGNFCQFFLPPKSLAPFAMLIQNVLTVIHSRLAEGLSGEFSESYLPFLLPYKWNSVQRMLRSLLGFKPNTDLIPN